MRQAPIAERTLSSRLSAKEPADAAPSEPAIGFALAERHGAVAAPSQAHAGQTAPGIV